MLGQLALTCDMCQGQLALARKMWPAQAYLDWYHMSSPIGVDP